VPTGTSTFLERDCRDVGGAFSLSAASEELPNSWPEAESGCDAGSDEGGSACDWICGGEEGRSEVEGTRANFGMGKSSCAICLAIS
jgi:hypothetical protein